MKLSELMRDAGFEVEMRRKWHDISVSGITDSYQQVEPGNCFVAIKGHRYDGHLFISDAVARGAHCAIVQTPIPPYPRLEIVHTEDTRKALALLAHSFFGHPSRKLMTVGITGTNGKTTTSYLLENILNAAQLKTAVFGTIDYRFGAKRFKALNTTPGSLKLARLFQRAHCDNFDAVVMEVSSHSVEQERIVGIDFNLGIFTNLSQDHLDYHRTMECYGNAKLRFFTEFLAQNPEAQAVINVDDHWGQKIHETYSGPQLTFGLRAPADLHVVDHAFTEQGTKVTLQYDSKTFSLFSPLLGTFNLYNLLSATAGALALGVSPDALAQGILSTGSPPGRFEFIDAGQDFKVVVDYSHTPGALEQCLSTTRQLCHHRVITVFGAGGERDQLKRPLMGKVAASYSDQLILTNDNPRSENPVAIASDIEKGILGTNFPRENYSVVLDRRAAIARAIELAAPGDFVLICGKGHEDYQVIGEEKRHFSDREVATELLREYVSERETAFI